MIDIFDNNYPIQSKNIKLQLKLYLKVKIIKVHLYT